MFGFLKDKLKKAINSISKSAEKDVKEEKVEDKQAIEQARKREEKLIKSAKKPAAKHEPKAAPKPEQKKAEPAPKPAAKPVEKKAEPKQAAKEEQRVPPQPIHVSEPKPTKETAKAAPEQKQPEKPSKPLPRKSTETAEPVRKAETPEEPKKKGFFSKLFGKKEKAPEEPVPTPVEEVAETAEQIEQELEQAEHTLAADEAIEEHTEVVAEEPVEEAIEEQKPGFLGKLKDAFTKKTLTEEKFDELFWELELAMLENNVAVEVIEKIKADLRDELTSGKVSRMGIEDMITARLRQSVTELFDVESFDLIERIKASPKPCKICIIGVNGSGKTTTLAKIVHLLKQNDISCVVAASDTFRAAAIDQLKEHTDRLDVKLITQGYGADPAAVAFDAIKHAEAKGIDVVLIDTAGRLHSNTNLMQELEKVVRVAKPDIKIFVGESITGNDCVEQATVFNKLVGIDAIILSKADIDEKGGAAISVSYVTGKPILYLGTGQTYDDLEPFDKDKIISSLELE